MGLRVGLDENVDIGRVWNVKGVEGERLVVTVIIDTVLDFAGLYR